MTQEQRFKLFKNNYFNNYTYVGITGNGKFKKQSRNNFIVFIFAFILLLLVYLPWEKIFGLNACGFILGPMSCLSGAILLLWRYTTILQARYKKYKPDIDQTIESNDFNIELIRFHQENIGMIDPFVVSRLLDDCKKKMDLWKQGSTVIINSFVVILSVIISVFLSPVLTESLGESITEGKLSFKINVSYFLLSTVVLGFLTWIQYLFTKNSLGPLHAYNQLYNSLEELRELLIKEEEESRRNQLIEELFLKLENERRSNKGFINNIINSFFN